MPARPSNPDLIVDHHLPELPHASRVAVLQSSPEVFEVLLRPPGWKRSYTWWLIFFGMLSGLWGVTSIGGLSNDASAFTLATQGFLACYFLGWLIHRAWTWKRMADEWTRIRIEDCRVSIRRPGTFWGEKTAEFRLERAIKYPRERYSAIHQLKLSGEGIQFICYTPLSYADFRWLKRVINRRIRGSESDDGNE